jgi:hypothetical protein
MATPIEINQYNNPAINEYNGKFSIVNMQRWNDGEWHITFVHPGSKSGPKPNKIPMGVLLGESKEQAIETLVAIYKQLTGDDDMSF